jgi:hypothetical protein
MNTTIGKACLLSGVALAVAMIAGAPSVMAQDGGRTEDPAPPPTTAPRPFESLDQNGDGAISKDEAAVDPPLAQVFGTLDKDADGRLSPEEYAVHTQGTP